MGTLSFSNNCCIVCKNQGPILVRISGANLKMKVTFRCVLTDVRKENIRYVSIFFFFPPHTFRNPEYLCVLEGVHDEDGEAQSKDVGKEAGVEIRSAVLLQTAGGEKIQNVILPHCDPTGDRAGAGART